MTGRIAIDARMIAHSGIGTHLRGLLEGFRGLAEPPELLLAGPPELIARHPVAAEYDVVPWSAPIYSIREQLTYPASELRRRGARAIHSPHYNMPVRAGGLRRIVTVHDLIHLVAADHLGFAARSYARFMMNRVARCAGRILAVSEHTRGDLARHCGVDPARVTITPNAVADGFGRDLTPERIEGVKERLGLPGGYVLTVGIDKPHKNYAFLVRVMCGLWAARETELPLVMAGIPRDSATPYRELVRMAGVPDVGARLLFPGHVPWDDLPALYAGATLLAVPSLYEGFGLPVLEAQTAGTPVAAARATSLPEVAGEAAAYFDPRDPDDASRVLLELLRDPARRAELSHLGRENATRFSWRRTAGTVAQVYREVLQA